MRIAIVSTPFIRVPPEGYGGTELFCYELAEELGARGHEVTIFATGDSQTRCKRRALYLHAEWPPTAADEVNHLAWALAEIERDGYDLVHLNSPLAIPLRRFLDRPVVYTIHHRREEAFSRVFAANAHPVHYVAISRRQLELEVPLPSATVIHHGLSEDRYPASRSSEGYLLHLGRFAEEKGTHMAIDAALLARMPLRLAGRAHPQDGAYLRKELEPRLALPGIRLIGEVGHDTKIALLRGARGLLLPLTWEEPFGLVAIEAMLSGTPVIAFPRGALPEIIDQGVTGILVADGDVDAMARAARDLATFDRTACAKRARERFTTQVMVDQYEKVYRRAVAEATPRKARAA